MQMWKARRMNTTTKTHHVFAHTLAIWLLVFAAGWFVMLTELVGARVLTPYFGNTIYVWGSVIGIFLLALAIGYAVGGRLTRRFSSPLVPAMLSAAGGLYVAFTPLFQNPLSASLYNTGMHVKWGVLIAAWILYGLPMVLLGGVSPYCVHIATKSRLDVGHRAGLLYAISTLGSFLGCLVTAFILIPGLPLAHVIVFAGIGMGWIAGIVALALADRRVPALGAAVLLIAAGIVVALRAPEVPWRADIKAYQYPLKAMALDQVPPENLGEELRQSYIEAIEESNKYLKPGRTILLEKETPYHHLVVVQNGPARQLIFGQPGFRGSQTHIDLRDVSWHVAEYTHLSFAALLFQPKPERVCVIGVGGAVIPRALEVTVPGVKVDAVDIDPAVIEVAQDYFYWRPSTNVRAFAQDGRSFLNWSIVNRQPLYDWIIVDAYEDDYVPFHLTTLEFIETARRMLAPGGVLAANMCIDADFYACEARSFEMVFGNATPFVGHRSGNIILISQNGRTRPMTVAEATRRAERLEVPPISRLDPKLFVSCLQEEPNWAKIGPVLSDSYAPVEMLLR